MTGTEVETSVVELFGLLRAAADVRVDAQHGPAKLGEQRRCVLTNARAKQLLGSEPRVTLAEGLRQTVAHFSHETGRRPALGSSCD